MYLICKTYKNPFHCYNYFPTKYYNVRKIKTDISSIRLKYVSVIMTEIERIFEHFGGSAEYNICISDAQYYEPSVQQNLWCEILEF